MKPVRAAFDASRPAEASWPNDRFPPEPPPGAGIKRQILSTRYPTSPVPLPFTPVAREWGKEVSGAPPPYG